MLLWLLNTDAISKITVVNQKEMDEAKAKEEVGVEFEGGGA